MFLPDAKCVAETRETENFGNRAAGQSVDMIILHYTGMPSGVAALDWLCNPQSGVSCHYFVDEQGAITQLVPEKMRAWHAGKSCWKGDEDINSRSIGIEIVNPGHEFGYRDFPAQQILAMIELCLDCGKRWSIAPQSVLAHSDVAPMRKEDPGERFPWHQLYQAGVGHWVAPAAIGSGKLTQMGDVGTTVESLQSMLSSYGYPVDVTGKFDELTGACTTAFQRHFSQEKVDGVADQSVLDTLQNLLDSLP